MEITVDFAESIPDSAEHGFSLQQGRSGFLDKTNVVLDSIQWCTLNQCAHHHVLHIE